MAINATAHAELSRLRRDIARIEGRLADAERLTLDSAPALDAQAEAEGLRERRHRARLRLGVAALDAAMGGGLPLAALHEIRAAESRDGGAASGFAQALSARLAAAGGMSSVLVISEADARREAGKLYAPGLAALGLDPRFVVEVAVRTEEEALWAFEAALSCHALDVAICELRQASLDLSATRRCALRARDAGVTGFLLRLGNALPRQARRNCASRSRRRRPARSAASRPASGAWPGRCGWRRTASDARALSLWSGMPMSEALLNAGPNEEPSTGRGGGQRIVSLFLPRLSTDRLIRLKPRASATPHEGTPAAEPPLAVVAKVKNALRVAAVDRIAEARGIRLGVTLADARGAVPDLVVEDADPAADHALLERIADWCTRYTPLVALDPPGGLFLDISGCAHLFAGRGASAAQDAGEERLLADCLKRLAGQGFAARGAVASTAGAAWALAHYGEGGLVPRGSEAETIAALPVASLRIGAAEEALLDRLGLKRVGQLIGKPRAPLAARFGADLVARIDQALGHLDEVLSPRRPAPRLSAERRFAEPVIDQDLLLETLASLAHTLVPSLERQGLGARLLEASFFRIDGAVTRAEIGTAAPLRAPDRIALLFSERLAALSSEWDAGFGFDMVRLGIHRAEPFDTTQIDLAGEAENGTGLVHLYDRLGARLGAARITRFLPVDTHIPERAVASELMTESIHTGRSASLTSPLRGGRPLQSDSGAGFGRGVNALASEETIEAPPDRPLRLFARPEPVEVLAEVPEGPPLRFRWRRVLHDVARAEGPERIAAEWWRPQDPSHATRDYFRVEDAEGRRYWLFREGLYDRETVSPLWYVHGLFA